MKVKKSHDTRMALRGIKAQFQVNNTTNAHLLVNLFLSLVEVGLFFVLLLSNISYEMDFQYF